MSRQYALLYWGCQINWEMPPPKPIISCPWTHPSRVFGKTPRGQRPRIQEICSEMGWDTEQKGVADQHPVDCCRLPYSVVHSWHSWRTASATEQHEQTSCCFNPELRNVGLIIIHTSSTAQGGGGSFKNRKPIGEVGCCESGMAERIHWWTERCLRSPTLALSFSHYLPTYLSIFYVSIYLSISLSFI